MQEEERRRRRRRKKKRKRQVEVRLQPRARLIATCQGRSKGEQPEANHTTRLLLSGGEEQRGKRRQRRGVECYNPSQ